MKFIVLCSLAALGLLAVPVRAAAQEHQDYSGKWALSQSKSTPGAAGNGALISFGSELSVSQSSTELKVEIRFPRVEQTQTITYKLDGSEVTVPLPEGVTEKAKATWQGDRLTITARRVVPSAFGEFVSETKEIWNRMDNVLTIQKTLTSEGVTSNETAWFDRQS
jgi:hypothetical protein